MLLADIFSALYKWFKRYLSTLIHQSEEPFNILLHTAIPEEPIERLATTFRLGRNRRLKELEIRVLTPAFYSRFAHYAYTSEAFDRECIFTDEKNRTLWISRPELLPLLMTKSAEAEAEAEDRLSMVTRGYLDELRWEILKKLRCAPARSAYGASSPSNPALTTEDVRSLPYSELDQCAKNRPRTESSRYRRMVTKLFIAQRLGFGVTKIIGLLDLIVRFLLCYLGLSQLAAMRAQIAQADILGSSPSMFRDGTVSACMRDVREVHGQWWWLVGAAVAVSTSHLYGFAKGHN
jgi:hypothetical protein